MKKFYFMLVAMFVAMAANASTVYFDNTDTNWTTVNAYAWNGTVTNNNNWPGNAMTKGEGNIWSIEFNGTPEWIVFNNGSGVKTGDLKFVDGATFDFYGVVGAEIPTFKVYFDNSTANWTNVKVHYWEGGAANGWPGDDMTPGANNIWSFELKASSAPKYIIFNNGSGAQTDNLDFTDGATYNENGNINDNNDGPEPLVAEHVYIVGDATPAGWNIGSPTELTKTGNYTFVYEGPLSAGEFKAYTSTGVWDCARIRPEVKGVTIDGNGVSNSEFVYKAGNDYKWQVTEAGNYRIVFDLEHYTITATLLGEIAENSYDYWYIGLAYGGNDWNAESFECRPDENGIAVFPEVASIGGYFRIRMWDNNEHKAYKLCGPEVSAVDTWYEADREEDNGDGAFHIVTPILTGAVVVTVDVLNNRVKLNYGAGVEPYTINVYYDNRVTKWDNVRIHAWNSVSNKSTDLDLTAEDNTGGMWYVNATIGFQPDMLLFFNGSWGEGNQTADMTFENNKTYGEAPAVKLEEGGVVWFNNTDNWEDVYVHYWNEGKDNGWPGEKMTHYAHPQLANKVNGEDADFGDAHGLYFFDIPAGGVQGIVFNNGLEGDDLRQTENIEGDAIRDKGVYSPSGYTNSTTGIDIIEAAGEGKAEYFNLQGVRVAEPANGLYIVRRGGKVTKEIIR